MHLLLANPDYFGKAGVLFYNLRNGVPEDLACRNALGKTRDQLEAQVKEHLAAGHFEAASLPSRPMNERDLPERPVSDAEARLARADLLAGAQSAVEYQALIKANRNTAEAEEGLGLLALREGGKDEARRHFSAAMEAGSSSARCFIEYAKLEPDRAKAEQALLRALGINSKLDEPFALLAARDTDPQKRLEHWKAAADRNPRNAVYWNALAGCYMADHNYAEAAKALTAGEQASVDLAERERFREARAGIEGQRIEYETAERLRRSEEDAREIQKLKDEALASIHATEDKLNKGDARLETKPVPWWDGATPAGKIEGSLRQVDCLGLRARLVIETDDRKTVRLLVSDASKVAINQPGQLSLVCGAQKPRRVTIEYFPKEDAQLSTQGEVASIEFQ
jgi:tetratricopeptide (TPR) repeat protein